MIIHRSRWPPRVRMGKATGVDRTHLTRCVTLMARQSCFLSAATRGTVRFSSCKPVLTIAALLCVAFHAAWARDTIKITIPRHSSLTPVQRLNREGVLAVQKHD